MAVLPWKQGVHGNKQTMKYYRLEGPMHQNEVRSEELQTVKFRMYVSVAMVTTFPCQQVIQFIVIT